MYLELFLTASNVYTLYVKTKNKLKAPTIYISHLFMSLLMQVNVSRCTIYHLETQEF